MKTIIEEIKIRACYGKWHTEDKYVDEKLQTNKEKQRNKLDY